MKIFRHAFILGAFVSLLFLSLDTAHAQSLPPRAYLFVEVSDTEGKAISDATVRVSTDTGEREFVHNDTNEAGVLKSNFYMWHDGHHYNLQVSKPGYLPYEQIFFVYSTGKSDGFIGRVEELSNSPEELGKSETSPIKIVLLKAPVTPEERRAVEAEERKRKFLIAAKSGDADGLRKLLQAGVKANTTDARGVPAIAWAALAGDPEAIKVLLDAGADVRNKNSPGHQALLIYLSEGIWRERKIKREPGYHVSTGPESARVERQEEVVRRLLQAGAGVNLPLSYRGTVLTRAIALIPHGFAQQYYLTTDTIKALIAAGARVKESDASGETPLMTAATMGSLEITNMLLAAGARSSVNARDNKGRTALMNAVSRYGGASAQQVVEALLSAGAKVNEVNEEGQTALMLAAKDGAWEILVLLLKSGASVKTKDKKGQTVLMYSSQPSAFRLPINAEISRELIRVGASVNEKDAEGMTALMYSSKIITEQSPAVSRVLIQGGALVNEKDLKGWTALMYASPRYYNDSASETARVLIEAGADVHAVNEDGQTALMLAARWYDGVTVRMLIAVGANVNARDKNGQTVLMHACQSFTPIELELFINAGAAASVNEKDLKGWTALMFAMSRYYASEDAKKLINAGADVNAVNEDGQTPLMLAAQTGSVKLIKTLLEAGARASINARDKQGRTALMYVKPKYPGDSVDEMVGELITAGANADGVNKTGAPPLR